MRDSCHLSERACRLVSAMNISANEAEHVRVQQFLGDQVFRKTPSQHVGVVRFITIYREHKPLFREFVCDTT